MKNLLPRKLICTLSLMAISFGFVFAGATRISIPESTEIRRTVLDSWIVAPLSQVNGHPSEDYIDSNGTLFQVRGEREGQSTVVAICPSTLLMVTEIVGQTVVGVEERPAFSRNSCGAWLLYRNRVSGEAEKIVIYFTETPDVYLQIRREGKKSLMDMMVYGSYLSRGVPLAIPFENLYTTSFQTIFNQTKKSLPWEKVVPDVGQYQNVKNMIVSVRRRLSSIKYAPDAAYNYKGELFSITTAKPYDEEEVDEELNYWLKEPLTEVDDGKPLTLGTSGFVKWIVDGLVRPIKNGYGTKIIHLIPQTIESNGISKMDVMSQKWNLTLNLDWNRHLAEQVYSLHTVRDGLSWKDCGVDVTDNFFVSTLSDDGRVMPFVSYVKNVGYRAKDLKSLMYVLAINEPDSFFLGAVRHSSNKSGGENVFDSNAVFMPYFRDNGKFDCVVFQNGEEMTLNQFLNNNQEAYVHLERVKSAEAFDLM